MLSQQKRVLWAVKAKGNNTFNSSDDDDDDDDDGSSLLVGGWTETVVVCRLGGERWGATRHETFPLFAAAASSIYRWCVF